MHKSGFVNIIGNPNVGKSTLTNALIGERISIVSPKAQTTRQRVLGFLNSDDYQIIFSDTPGYINKVSYSLHQKMLDYIGDAFVDADVLVLMMESGQLSINEELKEKVNNLNVPLLLVINKIDLSNQENVAGEIEQCQQMFPKAKIFPASALHNFNIDQVRDEIIELCPEHPPYYPKDIISDRYLRFFVSEMIREQIFHQFQKEIPYHTEVVITYFKEEEEIPKIGAVVYVSRNSQKVILLGKGGSAIKRLGMEARKSIEEFLGQHIFLDITIKVNENWRNDPNKLKNLGY
ncbi:MAG: GTPase Era [Bacteroidales bacterium]|nr:GTPase Era [Bacteroidales bacterium]